MAVEPVKKVRVIAHSSIKQQVVDTLQGLGTVHVTEPGSCCEFQAGGLSEEEVELLRHCSLSIGKADFLLSFLRDRAGERPGFVKTLIKDKYNLTLDEFRRVGETADLEEVYQECSELERELALIAEEKARLCEEAEELSNWVELEVPPDQLAEEHMYSLMPVRLARKDLEEFQEKLESGVPESCIDVFGGTEHWVCCLVLYHPSVEREVEEVLEGFKQEKAVLPRGSLEPSGRLEQIKRETAEMERREEELLERARGYLDRKPELEILREYLANERIKFETASSFGATRSTVLIEGWVTEGGMEKTGKALESLSPELYVEFTDPEEGDDPPVSLKNRKFAEPFELLTKLYGVPNRSEADPTIIIALSFMVFFGFCVGDVGYGVALFAAFLLMRKYLPLSERVKCLLLILSYGAVFAVVFGVLTGSWFGANPEKLPSFMKTLAVWDPLNNPVPIMGVCMALGIVHMLSGTIMEMSDNLKAGNIADAIIDQGLVILMFAGPLTAGVLALAGVIPGKVAIWVFLAVVVGMIVLLGHGAKSVPGKMFGGLYETYNTVVGWMGDTVSYVRLFALGLATFSVAWVLNTLAFMLKGIAPVIGVLLMLVLLVVGHTFNVAINLLGAFVHPLRLEYVEFFGKFYEDGGREFSPLRVESKIVMIREEAQ